MGKTLPIVIGSKQMRVYSINGLTFQQLLRLVGRETSSKASQARPKTTLVDFISRDGSLDPMRLLPRNLRFTVIVCGI